MSVIFKLFLTINSLSLSLLVFLVNKEVVVNCIHPLLADLPHTASYVLYAFIILILTWIGISLKKFLSSDSIDAGSISTVEPANDAFLPSYLGYFFVALSVPTFEMFLFG